MPLSEDEKATLAALQKKAEEPEPTGGGSSRQEVVNINIDLDNEEQVKRAVRAGYLPASYLEDGAGDDDGDDGGDDDGGDGPRRKSRYE